MIYELENEMWQAAKEGNKTKFAKLVSDDAVMVCGGYRCTGAGTLNSSVVSAFLLLR